MHQFKYQNYVPGVLVPPSLLHGSLSQITLIVLVQGLRHDLRHDLKFGDGLGGGGGDLPTSYCFFQLTRSASQLTYHILHVPN